MQASKRRIKSGNEFDHLFPRPANQSVVLQSRTTARDTVGRMEAIARERQEEAADIARLLKRDSLRSTCQAIWQFLFDYVSYAPDDPKIEQLRTPARTWSDRHAGVDCDCYSIFISAVLLNLGIDHAFRVADYGKGWQHVYVVVPSAPRPIVIDPVLDSFDTEQPPKKIFDHPVMKLEMLHGTSIGNAVQMQHYTSPSYPPASSAYSQTVNQVQDIRASQTHRALRGLGLTPPPPTQPEKPSLIKRIGNWVKDNPLATAGILVGGTLTAIGISKALKKKGRRGGSRSTNGLNGSLAGKSKRKSKRKTKLKSRSQTLYL